jgi:hypothetical protein
LGESPLPIPRQRPVPDATAHEYRDRAIPRLRTVLRTHAERIARGTETVAVGDAATWRIAIDLGAERLRPALAADLRVYLSQGLREEVEAARARGVGRQVRW